MSDEFTVVGAGSHSDIEQQVDPSYMASRVSLRPIEHTVPGEDGKGGHYYADAASGALTGVAANGLVYSCQWTDPSYLMVLKRVALVYYITTAYTTAQMNDFELIAATTFTAPDTGGTVVVPIPKRRSRMAQGSVVGDMRISSTAALTAGAGKTLDGAGLRIAADGPPNVAIPTATLGVPRQELLLYDNKEFGVHPKVFGKGEGWNIRMITAMGAVGVIKLYVHAEWAEVKEF